MYKDKLLKPRRVLNAEDTEIRVRDNVPRRVAKTEQHDIWLVEVKMPRRFVDEFSIEQIEAAEDAYVDMEDIQDGMDQSFDQPLQQDPMADTQQVGGL